MREGKVVHRELELHGKGVAEARSRRARAAAVNGPPVGLGIYEAPVLFEAFDARWFGFIDVVGAKDKRGRWVPVTEGGHWVVMDWKTTSSLDNALDEDGLRADVAANVYAYAAFEAGAKHVTCRWIYVTDHATPQVEVVEVNMGRDEVERLVRLYSHNARNAEAWLDSGAGLGDVPGRTGECYAFRRPCPALSICPHYEKSLESENVVQISTKPRRDRMRDDFEAQVAAVTAPSVPAVPSIPGLPAIPAIPAVPPPPSAPSLPAIPSLGKVDAVVLNAPFQSYASAPSLPTIPSLPAVPSIPKLTDADRTFGESVDAKPAVDKSVVNAPEGVAVPLASPEEAERVINEIYPPEAVETDELEAMDAPALKALAAKEGVAFSPRQQAKSLRAAIRTERRRKIVEGGVESVTVEEVARVIENALDAAGVLGLPLVSERGDVDGTAAVVGGQVAPAIGADEELVTGEPDDTYCNAGPAPKSERLAREPGTEGDYSDAEYRLAGAVIVFARAVRQFFQES